MAKRQLKEHFQPAVRKVPGRRIAKDSPGIMPAETMLKVMRYWAGRFDRAIVKRPTKAEKAAHETLIASYSERTMSAAARAAPYYHPTLATLQSNVNLTGRLTLEQLITQSMSKMLSANEDTGPMIEGEIVEEKKSDA